MTDVLGQTAQDLVMGKPTSGTVSAAAAYLAGPQACTLTSFSCLDPQQGYVSACNACYGFAYLYARYLVDRFGIGVLQKLTQSALTGTANVAEATGVSWTQIMRDFGLMLAVSGTGVTPATDAVTNLQALPLRAPFVDALGRSWTAAQLTPATAVTLGSATQTLGTFYPGSIALFTLPAPGAQGTTVKVTDVNGNRSLWVGLATK